MGASVFAYWPGITKKQLKTQPSFANDCQPWAEFLAELSDHPKAVSDIEKARAGALLSFKTEGIEDDDVAWVTPAELEKAALTLRKLVVKDDPSVRRLRKIYAENANEVHPVAKELAQDLADIAEFARWGRANGARKMTFDINW
jgi:hypothetical protein